MSHFSGGIAVVWSFVKRHRRRKRTHHRRHPLFVRWMDLHFVAPIFRLAVFVCLFVSYCLYVVSWRDVQEVFFFVEILREMTRKGEKKIRDSTNETNNDSPVNHRCKLTLS